MDRDCDRCVYSTRSGGCRSWSCNFQTVEDIKAEARADCFNETLRFADQESYKEGFKRGIEQGKADGAKEFAEWLVDKGILGNRCIYNGEITDYGKVYLAEWQKGTE